MMPTPPVNANRGKRAPIPGRVRAARPASSTPAKGHGRKRPQRAVSAPPTPVGRGRAACPGLSGNGGSEVELEVLDVGEADLLQLAGAASVVLEVHLLERFGGDLLDLLVAGAPLLGVEEAGGVAGR